MLSGQVTTPFGRRPVTLAIVKSQIDSAEIEHGKTVDKWTIYRDACTARTRLGLRDRALAVLNALLTFYPETRLSEGSNLVVFPSNAQLSARANGIAGTTLRENLATLVQAGLIFRNDSPNGKRYARKNGEGSIETAFGFSLAPLLRRSEELAVLAQQVAAENLQLKIIKEKISITRRDIRKLLTAAIVEGVEGNWGRVEDDFVSALARLKPAKRAEDLAACLDELTLLLEGVSNILENQLFSRKSASNDDDIRHHIQNSNTNLPHEFEPSSGNEQGAKSSLKSDDRNQRLTVFPLRMVVRACPQISDYARQGKIESWRDLMAAAVIARGALAVSPSAYQEACEVLGAESAAIVIACILERGGHINSPGGYLRDLTARAQAGKFSLGPMLMALLRLNTSDTLKTG